MVLLETLVDASTVGTVRLSRVPGDEELRALASRVRRQLGSALYTGTPHAVAAALGWRYGSKPIGDATSTILSLLIPLRCGGFSILVNAHHAPADAEALWLAAHEIGHSFFYAPGRPPRRIIPCTDAEERFCDVFAQELLFGRGPCSGQYVA